MEVIKARCLGLCSGVNLAVETAYEAIRQAKELGVPCYIYGDIVHNAHVMERIRKEGVVKVDEPGSYAPGVLIIRTHGITDTLRASFISRGFIIKDATCPVVLKNQERVRDSARQILIVGLEGHSEVTSLIGSTDKKAMMIDSKDKLSLLSKSTGYDAIVQTTFSSAELEAIKAEIDRLGLDVAFLNDICSSSQLRRDSIRELKDKVDAIIVVGDSKSANARELLEVAKEVNENSFLIDSVENLAPEMVKYAKIGLSAGASTPDYIYSEVETYLRSIDNGR